MTPKRVLDLFCGAGGAAMGLHRAWPDAKPHGLILTQKEEDMATENDVLKSRDAREWAAAFMAVLAEHPEIKVDDELMVTWFANALMRGYDEHYWRSAEYKRSIRRALHPWWSWRRYALLRRQHG